MATYTKLMTLPQLEDVKKILTESLNPNQLKSDQIFFMGDLNINGNPWTMKEMLRSDLPKCSTVGRPVPPGSWKPGISEWRFHFDPSLNRGSFFAGTLSDTWAFNTSSFDFGQTAGGGPGEGSEAFPYYPNKDEGFRYDYIFHSKPEVKNCMQHIARAYSLADTHGVHYSDHLGVKLDVNRLTQYCSPVTPHASPAVNQEVSGIIQHKGSMEWYRIDQPGSYSIKTTSTGNAVDFRVYEASDLSRPLAAYYGQRTEWGLRFPMPKPPYYVRAFAKERDWTGTYTIQFHRHEGKSYQDSIVLEPAIPHHYPMPALPLNNENAVWFTFTTGKSVNDELPLLRFNLDYYKDHSFDFKLYEGSSRQLIPVTPSRSFSPRYPDHLRHEFSLNNLPEGDYYLVVRPRPGMSPQQVQGRTFIVEWQTNLTYFHPHQLKCHIQDDTFGDDEISYRLEIDGKPRATDYKHFSDFDEETALPARPVFGVLGFLSTYKVFLMEEDSFLNFEDDYWGAQTLHNLPHDIPDPGRESSVEVTWSEGSTYKYVLHGRLSRYRKIYDDE